MSVATAACDARRARPYERPAAPAVDPAERAADELRDRLVGLDAEGCADAGGALVRAHPDRGRLRAWWIACVAAAGRHAEAEAQVAAWLSERPDDPHAELARVLAWIGESPLLEPQALLRSAALLERLPERDDAVRARAWALMALRAGDLRAFVAAEPGAPAVARVTALLLAARGKPSRLPEALAVAHAVPEDDPEFAAVAELMARRLPELERPVEALAWAEAGLRRAPQAPGLLRQRWTLQAGQAKADPEAVVEDIEATRQAFADRPAVLLAAAESLRALGQAGRAGPIEAAILAGFPDSPEAEAVLYRRLEPARGAAASADPDALSLRRTMLAAYLARPQHHSLWRRENAARWQFEAVVADPTAEAGAIVAAVEEMMAHRRWLLDSSIEAARALVERTKEFERAEALAQAGQAGAEAFAAAWSAVGSTTAEMVRRDYALVTQTILGGLYLKTGRIEEASAALGRAEALAVTPYGELQLYLAELARRRGDDAAADTYLAEGTGLPGDQGERCRRALEDAYRRRTGGLRGFSAHLEGLLAADRARRKAEVLAGWTADARALPDFRLARANGDGELTLSSLRGRIVVLHFWFNTCTGCLQELPAFAEFAAAHAGEPDVAVVSLHFGGTASEVAAWTRERGIGFEVLMDPGYSGRVGVDSFPTTWFLDQDGRLRFAPPTRLVRHLREEFDWRLEALRGRAGPRVPGGAVAG